MYKNILKRVNFVDRYTDISRKFHFDLKDGFEKFSNDEVLRVVNHLGYQVKYLKGDNFFKIAETINPFKFHFNIVLKGGIVEFIWGVWKGDKPQLELSDPWGVVADDMGYESPIRKPLFRNYEDLQEILKEAFNIYEDFKRELLKEESQA